MKMGISVWSFPADYTLEKVFKTAKDAGFDGVEVAMDETGVISVNSTAEDMEKVKTLATKYGLELYSLASLLYWDYPLTSSDEKVRAKGVDIIKKQLQVASWLGCDTILVVPGAVGVDFLPHVEVVDYDVAYERAFDAIEQAKEEAQRLGVSIGVENVWNKFLLSPLEMRDFIDRQKNPYVGSYFDVGNVLNCGYPEQWIKILAHRIKKVHFKDFRTSVGNINGFVDLLAGDVNYPAVISALEQIGYDGWVTAEMGLYRDHCDQIVYNTANSMRRILNV